MKKLLITFLSIASLGLFFFLYLGNRSENKKTKSPAQMADDRLEITQKNLSSPAPKHINKSSKNPKKKVKRPSGTVVGNLNIRQEQLLKIFRNDKTYAMSSIEGDFPGVNVRTLRRDLDKLQHLGLIKKTGSTKASLYQKV